MSPPLLRAGGARTDPAQSGPGICTEKSRWPATIEAPRHSGLYPLLKFLRHRVSREDNVMDYRSETRIRATCGPWLSVYLRRWNSCSNVDKTLCGAVSFYIKLQSLSMYRRKVLHFGAIAPRVSFINYKWELTGQQIAVWLVGSELRRHHPCEGISSNGFC